MPLKIFLSGPIFHCSDHECIDWRLEAMQRLTGHGLVNPMDRDYRGRTNEFHRRIVEDDKAAIDGCDVLLVNYFKASVGTSMEILYAWERGKHVVVFTREAEVSPWLLYHAHKLCSSLEEATAYINSIAAGS